MVTDAVAGQVDHQIVALHAPVIVRSAIDSRPAPRSIAIEAQRRAGFCLRIALHVERGAHPRCIRSSTKSSAISGTSQAGGR
jgi:hypothetical protein